jgi:hypothetical protein
MGCRLPAMIHRALSASLSAFEAGFLLAMPLAAIAQTQTAIAQKDHILKPDRNSMGGGFVAVAARCFLAAAVSPSHVQLAEYYRQLE